MKKKFLVLGAAFVMLFSVVGMMGCSNDYIFNEEDFRLTVSVDKTEARVGDIVTVTATLENLSGRNLRVQSRHPRSRDIEDILNPMITTEYGGLRVFGVDGWIGRNTFRRDTIIERQLGIEMREEGSRVALVIVAFSIGRRNTRNRMYEEQNRIWIYFVSEKITITIQGEN